MAAGMSAAPRCSSARTPCARQPCEHAPRAAQLGPVGAGGAGARHRVPGGGAAHPLRHLPARGQGHARRARQGQARRARQWPPRPARPWQGRCRPCAPLHGAIWVRGSAIAARGVKRLEHAALTAAPRPPGSRNYNAMLPRCCAAQRVDLSLTETATGWLCACGGANEQSWIE